MAALDTSICPGTEDSSLPSMRDSHSLRRPLYPAFRCHMCRSEALELDEADVVSRAQFGQCLKARDPC
eukprot:6183039-Pleurochrysis_carterae.AAC.1